MTKDRRQLASRDTGWARRGAAFCLARGWSPNGISQASMGFAALACAGFCLIPWIGAVAGLVVAILGMQMRLVCNLMDGMVAVEGGKAGPDGDFWNEVPDRVADILILTGAGVAVGLPSLGLAAALSAVLTAYIRAVGSALGHGADFRGPMAKQHRMALMTGACVLGGIEVLTVGSLHVLVAALVAVTLGAVATALRRGRTLVVWLRAR